MFREADSTPSIKRLELSDAELALTESKMNQLNLIFSLKMAKLHLDKALGLLGGD